MPRPDDRSLQTVIIQLNRDSKGGGGAGYFFRDLRLYLCCSCFMVSIC